MKLRQLTLGVALAAIGMTVTAQSAAAAVISIGSGAFGAGSTLTTFDGQTDGAEVHGLTVDGIGFQYSLGAGHVILDGGPGITNSVAPLNVVSIGNNSGILSMTLPFEVTAFGYGFAIQQFVPVDPATTISLFNGAMAVGSLSFPGVPDPSFTGGFAGIQSSLAFDRVELTFNSTAAPAFALDNIRMSKASVPEPATILLLGTGLAGLYTRRRRR